jgi:four helix bundle protein
MVHNIKDINDLEDRLIRFSVTIINIAEALPQTFAGKHLAGQIIRAGTSSALNYGEAQSAESRKDFIHKVKIVLKELKETRVGLKIIRLAEMYGGTNDLNLVIKENNELIAIFISSVNTARKNLEN